jgi:hypothetical protein
VSRPRNVDSTLSQGHGTRGRVAALFECTPVGKRAHAAFNKFHRLARLLKPDLEIVCVRVETLTASRQCGCAHCVNHLMMVASSVDQLYV